MPRRLPRTRTARRARRRTTSAVERFPTNRRTADRRQYPRTFAQASSATDYPAAARSRRANRAFSSYLRRTVGASTILGHGVIYTAGARSMEVAGPAKGAQLSDDTAGKQRNRQTRRTKTASAAVAAYAVSAADETIAAKRAAISRTSRSSLPSTMTLITGSVPEARSTTLPSS